MLKSYDAIYDKGRLHWVGRAPQLEHARVMVVVSEPDTVIRQCRAITGAQWRPFGSHSPGHSTRVGGSSGPALW